ncbi:MAG: EamA family transporter [Akkermansiaceae bacterium]|nr:EamA family transporter [Akkermansiaceae bacterium]
MLPVYLLIPLVSAIVYALGAILVKRALKEGVSMDQTFHITNFMVGVVFLPFLFLETNEIDWSLVWKPIIMGTLFFVGNWLSFVGIKRGDVSLVTPIMGTKVVFVAIATVVLTGAMPSGPLWIAAVLTTLGIFVMGIADLRGGHKIGFTVAITLASACMFGVCDVIVAWWATGFGAPTFLAIGSITVAVNSAVLWVFQRRPSLRLAPRQKSWTWWAALLIGFQAVGMGVALSYFDDATGVNIVYASRGLWTIVLVVVFGVALGNSEVHDTGKTFLWRVLGTVVLAVAIFIAVIHRSQVASATF